MYEEVDVVKHRQIGPSVWDSATELPRILFEVTSLAYSWPVLTSAPRGDGHPIMVLPGFTAGDESTLVLRRFLTRLNYLPHAWEQGQNTGSFEVQERLVQHFYRLTANLDRKISLIGQSLGGVYARALARQFPERIRQVITLGSPFSSKGPEATNALVARLFQYMSGMTAEEMRDQMLVLPQAPLPVPTTAIYSKTDGVVHWTSCLELDGEQSENIEVLGSHSGMAHNPLVFHVLADRLSQPEGEWRPFRRAKGCRSFLFPEPEQRS